MEGGRIWFSACHFTLYWRRSDAIWKLPVLEPVQRISMCTTFPTMLCTGANKFLWGKFARIAVCVRPRFFEPLCCRLCSGFPDGLQGQAAGYTVWWHALAVQEMTATSYCRCARNWRFHASQRGAFLRLIGPDSDWLDWGLSSLRLSDHTALSQSPHCNKVRECCKPVYTGAYSRSLNNRVLRLWPRSPDWPLQPSRRPSGSRRPSRGYSRSPKNPAVADCNSAQF